MKERFLDIVARACLAFMVAGCPRALTVMAWTLKRAGDVRRLIALQRMTATMLTALNADVVYLEGLSKELDDQDAVTDDLPSWDGTTRWFSQEPPKDDGLTN